MKPPKKVLLTAVLSSFLFIGAMCGTTDIAGLIAQVQSATTKACAFVPTAETIIAIFATNNAALASAEAIASSICAGVKPHAASAQLVAPVLVGGVKVEGYFIRR